jgi:hypothetical protein
MKLTMITKHTMQQRRIFTFLIFILMAGTVSAQPLHDFQKRVFPFYQSVTEATDKDSILHFNESIAILFKPASTEMDLKPELDLSANWQLLYYRDTENRSYYDGKNYGYDSKYIHKTNTEWHTTAAILDTFAIDKNFQPLNQAPLIYARDSPFNGDWTVILPDPEYMIIRWVHSYPDGNAQSWYKEKIYYFKKAGQ